MHKIKLAIRRLAPFFVAFVALVSVGCATSGPATIQAGPEAETTYDGLHKVDNAKADEAWARADFDISGYTKIMIVETGFQYTPTKNKGRSQTERALGGPYLIDDKTKARFETLVTDVFLEELHKSKRFTIVDEPGPDVLFLSAELLDISSFVPGEVSDPLSGIWIREVAEATLVLELIDSESGTVLARSIDRRAAKPPGTAMQESHVTQNVGEVTRLIQLWATRLREGLDGFVQ